MSGKKKGPVRKSRKTCGLCENRERDRYVYGGGREKICIFLCSTYTIGGVRAERLLARFGSPRAVYEAEAEEWRECVGNSAAEALERQKKSGEWEQEYGQLSEQQIHFLLREEKGFPGKLAEIPDPPYGIFYRGKLPDENEPAVAVIGARECSEYGRYVAEELGQYLGRAGIQVISGMARGIDGISQQAALSAGGTSYGVLGCGVDICYPAQNRRLYEELLEKGDCSPPMRREQSRCPSIFHQETVLSADCRML